MADGTMPLPCSAAMNCVSGRGSRFVEHLAFVQPARRGVHHRPRSEGGGRLLATLPAPRYTTTEEETGEAMDDAEAAGRRRENSQHRLLAGFDGSWMRDGLGRVLIVRDLGPVAYWAVFEKVQSSGEKFLGYSRFTALHLQVYRLESYYLQDLQVQSYPVS